ncbi:hypothetical protein, partial [Streptomyces sp. NL15-2K]|uniref:hypothetical protein n=1 Tax=Streptomyces sp. NL15-2K TaxID=376149 RepID=UPI001C0EB97D
MAVASRSWRCSPRPTPRCGRGRCARRWTLEREAGVRLLREAPFRAEYELIWALAAPRGAVGGHNPTTGPHAAT